MGLFGLFSKKERKADSKAKGKSAQTELDDDGQAKYLKDAEPTPVVKAEPKPVNNTAPKAEPKATKPAAPKAEPEATKSAAPKAEPKATKPATPKAEPKATKSATPKAVPFLSIAYTVGFT